MNEHNTTKSVMFHQIKEELKNYSSWDYLETEIRYYCNLLTEPLDNFRKSRFLEELKQLKAIFLSANISEETLLFIDEEIERYELTKQVSLYNEEDNRLSQEIIDKYSRLVGQHEGVLSIHLSLNYAQLKKLTNGVYKKTGRLNFYVSRERTVAGKVTGLMYDHEQEIPIMTLLKPQTKAGEEEKPCFVSLFGDPIDKRRNKVVREIPLPFYFHRFLTHRNQEVILMSKEKITVGDYIMTGVMTKVDELRNVGDSARLPTKLPYFFVNEAKNRIMKYDNHEELRKMLGYLGVNKSRMFDFPFTMRLKGENTLPKYHDWFKWLVWAWLLHTKKGLFNKYPLHIIIMGAPGSGKSLLMNVLHARSKETADVTSGSSSTLKALIPSFKYNPVKLGYLAQSNRFSFCDEFFRALTNIRSGKNHDDDVYESVSLLNDLLEHQKRECGSGIGSVTVNMTSRIIATTNPPHYCHNVEDLLTHFEKSFMTRWLVYHQGQEDLDLVNEGKNEQLKKLDFNLSDDEWIGLVDYLHSFDADYDMKAVQEVMVDVKELLTEEQKKHYDARHQHHAECLLDGIVKARCLFEKDMSFKADNRDYDVFVKVWTKVVGSWVDVNQLHKIAVGRRINYLPEFVQKAYYLLVNHGLAVTRQEYYLLLEKDLDKRQITTALVVLVEQGLINEQLGVYRPYFVGVKDSWGEGGG